MIALLTACFWNPHARANLHQQKRALKLCSATLNPNYFHSTKIFVQLQPKIISFNENNCSTSTKNNFIQQQYFFNFNPNYFLSTKIIIQLQPKIILFNNKVPGHSKYRHSTKSFPVPPRLNTKQHWVTQATYRKPLKYSTERRANYLAIPWFEIHSCSRDNYKKKHYQAPATQWLQSICQKNAP